MGIMEQIENAKETNSLFDELSEEDIIASDIAYIIANGIFKRRRALGLTQQELADKLGVSQVMISRWESGEPNYTIETLVKLSIALGVNLREGFASIWQGTCEESI
jgi:ribosome-binding protein aMBF1 (putative translation factor)